MSHLKRCIALVLASGWGAAAGGALETQAPPRGQTQEITEAGVTVRFEIEPVPGAKAGGRGLAEGAQAVVRFRVSDATGTALVGLDPIAWLDLRRAGPRPDDQQCRAKIQSLLQANLGARATLDLNTYYVLALNEEASVSVLDPIRGFGGSRLFTLVQLKGPGEDWSLSRDRARLFISMPHANQVAVVDTATWKVMADVEAGPRPTRLALQADGAYLWADNGTLADGTGGDTVSVVDAAGLKPAARIRTGAGPHAFAFTPDDRYAFVSNREQRTVSIVDVRTLAKVKDVPTGGRPADIAFSALCNCLYVAQDDGAILALDAGSRDVVARVQAEPGLVAVGFAPGARWGFAVNRARDSVHVFDATTGRLRHTIPVEKAPDQVAFTADYAYVRALDSDQVTMISLAGLGTEAGPSINELPAGQRTPARAGRAIPAAVIVPAPEPKAVLVANPADQLVYYYTEGMAAPMGSFNNYRRTPRAVLVVDRSLRETAPGEYTISVGLPAGGAYDVAFLLDSPRVVHCFEASVAPEPALGGSRKGFAPRVEPLTTAKQVPVGSALRLRFKVTDAETGRPRMGLEDLEILTTLAPGTWRNRQRAMPADDGIYEAVLTPPQAGVYYVHWQCPSAGLPVHQSSPFIFHATEEAVSNEIRPQP